MARVESMYREANSFLNDFDKENLWFVGQKYYGDPDLSVKPVLFGVVCLCVGCIAVKSRHKNKFFESTESVVMQEKPSKRITLGTNAIPEVTEGNFVPNRIPSFCEISIIVQKIKECAVKTCSCPDVALALITLLLEYCSLCYSLKMVFETINDDIIFAINSLHVENVGRVMLNKRDNSLFTLLHYFVMLGCIAGVKLLLSKNVDVNMKGEKNVTALILAVLSNSLELVRLLLSKGANPKLRDDDDKSALHHAAEIGNMAMIELLLELVPCQLWDFQVKSVLHVACQNGRVDIVRKLLCNKHIRIDALDENGNTSLHLASIENHQEIVDLLLENNASVEVANISGLTVLHNSKDKNWHYNANESISKKLIKAINTNNIKELEYYMSIGCDVNHISLENGNTYLHLACDSNQDVFDILLDNDADANVSNYQCLTPLMLTCESNQPEKVGKLIDAKASLSFFNSDGNSALHIAALKGYFEVIRVLLTRSWTLGTDKLDVLNMINHDGYTPVMCAAANSHKECVDYLICAGSKAPDGFLYERVIEIEKSVSSLSANFAPMEVIDVPGVPDTSSSSSDKKTEVVPPSHDVVIHQMLNRNVTQLLYHCCKHGMVERVKYLLTDYNKRHRVNMKTEDKSYVLIKDVMTEVITYETPLYVACYYGHTEVVRVLLENGALPNILARNGWSCLFIAAKKNFADIVNLLIEAGADVHFKNKNNMSVLNIAAYGGHIAIVNKLVGCGCDVNEGDKMGAKPLHAAVQSGNLEVARVLLANNADVNGFTLTGITPLYVAAYSGHIDFVRLFDEHQANLDQSNNEGLTPLIVASFNGRTDIVQYLMDRGASILQTDKKRVTTLYAASQNGHLDVWELLVAAHMDVNQPIGNGNTPAHAAAIENRVNILQRLKACGAGLDVTNIDGATPFYMTCEKGHLAAAEYLISTGVSVNAINVHKVAPISIAAQNGHTSIVKLLIDKKASINVQADKGPTPLFMASQNGHKDICKLLIDAGANVDLKTIELETAIFVAAYFGRTEIVQMLIDAKATIDLIDRDGRTPIWWASKAGKTEVVKLLLKYKADSTISDREGVTPLAIAAQNNHKEVSELLSAVTMPAILCSVCLTNARNVLFLPCKHLACCQDCDIKLERARDNKCPICRTHVDKRIPVFL